MKTQEDLDVLVAQEADLHFAYFNADVAWQLGNQMRNAALTCPRPVAIGIWLAGQTLFYGATVAGGVGTTTGNEDWLRRKRNTVQRFGKSSLRVGLELERDGTTLETRQGLTLADYAAHGGGFPLFLERSGCVGAIVVSGLTQREDHDLAVEAIAALLGKAVPRLSRILP